MERGALILMPEFEYQPQIEQTPLMTQQEQYMPSQVYQQREADNVLRTLLENEDLINLLEHEFKGEVMVVINDEPRWIQKHKPIIGNSDGINEVLRILRFMGLNKVSLLTSLDFNQINEKLRTFEYKLADLMFLKRQAWEINKEELPMIYHMIISIVEDAIFRAKDGQLIKTIRSTFQRQETEHQDKTKRPGMLSSMMPFK